jgi:hypothetical protein
MIRKAKGSAPGTPNLISPTARYFGCNASHFQFVVCICLCAGLFGLSSSLPVSAGQTTGGRLVFSETEHSEERALVQKKDGKEISDVERIYSRQLAGRRVPISIAVADLNDDGVVEIFAHFSEPESWFCGTRGCALYVYQRQGKYLKVILGLITFSHEFEVMNTRTSGYRDMRWCGDNREWIYLVWRDVEYTFDKSRRNVNGAEVCSHHE